MNKNKAGTGNNKPKQPASTTKSTKPKEAAKKSATTTTAKTAPKTSTSAKPTPVTNTTASAKKTPATKANAKATTTATKPPPAPTVEAKNSNESATTENNTNVTVESPPNSTAKVDAVKVTAAPPKASAKKAPAATAKSKTSTTAKSSTTTSTASSVKAKPATTSTSKTSATKTPAAAAKTSTAAKPGDKKRAATTSTASSVKPKSATATGSKSPNKSGKSSANTSKSNSRQSSRQVSPASTVSDRSSKVSTSTPDSHETPAGTPNDTPEDSVTRPRANTTSLRDLVTVFESTAQLIAASTQPPEKSPRRSSVKSSTLRQLSKKFEQESEDSTDDLRKYLSLRHIKDLDASSELLRSPHVTENIPLLLWSNHVSAEHVVSNDHVLVTSTSEEYVTVWDLLENTARQFSGHTSHVTGMALAAEGDQIVTLSEHEILSWRASDCHVTGHQQLRAELVALTSDGNHAVTAVNAELTLWTGEDLKALKTISHGDHVTCLTMWPRSAGQLLFIVTGSRDRAIRLWDLATGECLSTIEDAHQGPITALRVLSQGRHVISYSDTDQHVKVWELADKECVLQHHVSESCVRTPLIKVVSDWSQVTAREGQWDDLLLATEIQNLKLQIGLSEQCCCILVSD